MAYGLQSATEGFMRGSDWRQGMERNKKLDRVLGMEVESREAFAGMDNPWVQMMKRQLAQLQQSRKMSALGDEVMGGAADTLSAGLGGPIELDEEMPTFADGGNVKSNVRRALDESAAERERLWADTYGPGGRGAIATIPERAAAPFKQAYSIGNAAMRDVLGMPAPQGDSPAPRSALSDPAPTSKKADPADVARLKAGGPGPGQTPPDFTDYTVPETEHWLRTGERKKGKGATGPAGAASPAAPKPAAPAAASAPFDLSSLPMTADSMPQMGAADWLQYRIAMTQAAQKAGRPELVQQVNDQITGMQHQGFIQYGQQAVALLAAGDEEGAKKALIAAYSHFPNGSNVKFAVQGDQLVGYGINEKTGKPTGAMAVTPQMLDQTLRQFADPKAFAAYTVDKQNADTARMNADTQRTHVGNQYELGKGNLAVNQGELGLRQQMAPYQQSALSASAFKDTAVGMGLGGSGRGGGGGAQGWTESDRVAFSKAVQDYVPPDVDYTQFGAITMRIAQTLPNLSPPEAALLAREVMTGPNPQAALNSLLGAQ